MPINKGCKYCIYLTNKKEKWEEMECDCPNNRDVVQNWYGDFYILRETPQERNNHRLCPSFNDKEEI